MCTKQWQPERTFFSCPPAALKIISDWTIHTFSIPDLFISIFLIWSKNPCFVKLFGPLKPSSLETFRIIFALALSSTIFQFFDPTKSSATCLCDVLKFSVRNSLPLHSSCFLYATTMPFPEIRQDLSIRMEPFKQAAHSALSGGLVTSRAIRKVASKRFSVLAKLSSMIRLSLARVYAWKDQITLQRVRKKLHLI